MEQETYPGELPLWPFAGCFWGMGRGCPTPSLGRVSPQNHSCSSRWTLASLARLPAVGRGCLASAPGHCVLLAATRRLSPRD